MEHPRAVRWSIAAGLFVEFVGFLYDTLWHDQHLSEVAIPPSKLMTVHSGIYLGELLVLGIALATLALRTRRAHPQAVLWAVVAGGLVQIAGSGFDMWSHAHAYEKPLYHDTIYTGAAVTIIGYLLLEILASRAARQEQVPAPDAVADRRSDEAKQTAER
ncbi:hypothetical protein [Streptomyces sp. SPB162]|uniref:hypothetical protein n=1 Tax=Streptomyces sp. SPB162 TaxID=2940560 RepID=UPI002406396C|nr:hypothetical protein [Streptomyces sp. SPB162]MDF9817156.1 hypothetical protein [Streptomyces sp. SPB162]